jgi:hypothetical protein
VTLPDTAIPSHLKAEFAAAAETAVAQLRLTDRGNGTALASR